MLEPHSNVACVICEQLVEMTEAMGSEIAMDLSDLFAQQALARHEARRGMVQFLSAMLSRSNELQTTLQEELQMSAGAESEALQELYTSQIQNTQTVGGGMVSISIIQLPTDMYNNVDVRARAHTHTYWNARVACIDIHLRLPNLRAWHVVHRRRWAIWSMPSSSSTSAWTPRSRTPCLRSRTSISSLTRLVVGGSGRVYAC